MWNQKYLSLIRPHCRVYLSTKINILYTYVYHVQVGERGKKEKEGGKGCQGKGEGEVEGGKGEDIRDSPRKTLSRRTM